MVHDFDYIYHKYYDDIYKYVYSYTLNEYDTEDIVQKTFLKQIQRYRMKKFEKNIKICLILCLQIMILDIQFLLQCLMTQILILKHKCFQILYLIKKR